MKLRLFPFSLQGKAQQWESNLPHGSITTWEACKTAFLAKFFSPVRTAKIRNDIASFKQHGNESFYDAHERFRQLTHQCPHHGFSETTLLSTLFRGLLPKYRDILNAASNGSFLAKDATLAKTLVENLASSDSVFGEDYDRVSRNLLDVENTKRDKEMKALNDRLDQQASMMTKQATIVDKLLSSPKATTQVVNYVDDYVYEDDQQYQFEEVKEEEVNYVGNQGYNYQPNHPNLSYRNTNVANPQDNFYPPRQNQGQQLGNTSQAQPRPQGAPQATQGQAPQRSNPAPPGFPRPQQGQQGYPRNQQGYGNQAQPRFTNPQQAYGQPQQGFGNFQQQGFNQGQQQQAPLQGIPQPDLASMMQQLLSAQTAQTGMVTNLTNRLVTMEDEIKQLKRTSASTSQQAQLPGKPEANPKAYINTFELQSIATLTAREISQSHEDIGTQKEEVELIEKVGLVRALETSNAREVAEAKKQKAKLVEEAALERKRYIPPPPFVPKLPYPGRFKQQQAEQHKGLVNKTIKESVSESSKDVESMMVAPLEVNAITQQEVSLTKLEDPGTFTIPCAIGSLAFQRSLCDLGASHSLMPFSVAKSLGVKVYKSTTLKMVLADRSIRTPIGLLENVPVLIQGYKVPTDFIVLEMDEEPQDPILLGRPFLATAGAMIDVKGSKIDLHLGLDKKLEFIINEPKMRPTINGQSFSIEMEEKVREPPPRTKLADHAYAHCFSLARIPYLEPCQNDANEKSLLEIERLIFGAQDDELMVAREAVITKTVEIKAPRVAFTHVVSTPKAGLQKRDKFGAKALGYGNCETTLELDGFSLHSLFSPIIEKEVEKDKTNDNQPFTFAQSSSTMTLTPWKYEGDAIKYKVKCKGRTKPFAKVRAILSTELDEKGDSDLHASLNKKQILDPKEPPWRAHSNHSNH